MCHEFAGNMPGPVHPRPTATSGLCYFFHPKHRNNDAREGQWAITTDDEFAVFEVADANAVAHKGDLFGVHRRAGKLLPLGAMKEMVAQFHSSGANHPWHGFPMWPITPLRTVVRKQKEAPKAALDRMIEVGLITWKERLKMRKGG